MMDKSKGKCKTCFGCNRLNDDKFTGVEHCKEYIRADKRDWFILIAAIIGLVVIGFGIYGFYVWFSRQVGG